MPNIPTDQLDAGDATPKLVRASLKDIVVAINRISYTFKTPDLLIAPDALQLEADGNLSLGNVPLAYSAVGRNIRVSNTSATGDNSSNSSVLIESTSGAAFLNFTTASALSGINFWDGSNTITPSVQQSWYQPQGLWRLKVLNASTQRTALKINTTGQVGLGENSILQANLNIGEVGSSTINEIYVASNTTNFEGAFLGAFNAASGAKLELNSQANATNVSSWRISHDLNVGGQGRLSFSFAAAATARNNLTYNELFSLSNAGMTFGGKSRSVGGATRLVHIENANNQASLAIVRNSDDIHAAVLALGKSRGTGIGSNILLQDQDIVGAIQFCAGNGTDLNTNLAGIEARASGVQTSTSTPGELIFSTAKVNSVQYVPAVRITNQQNVLIGTASDSARLTMVGGNTYPSGEGVIYLQSNTPSTVPALVFGSSGGTISISGGAAQAAGGARGGQIDFVGGGSAVNPGKLIFRAGTNADGLPSAVGACLIPGGMFGINTVNPTHRVHAIGNDGERIRVMMDAFGEYGGFTGRRANGTFAVPTKILATNALAFFNVHGYTGTQYVAAGQITIQAEQDWTDTNTPSSIILAPGATGSAGQNSRFIVKSNGNTGVNAMNPVSVFNVTHSTVPAGVGFEVDPDPVVDFIQMRSYNRTTGQYRGWAEAANSFQWGSTTTGSTTVGANLVSTRMALTNAGNLSIGPNAHLYVHGESTGATMTDGQVIISTTSSVSAMTTALCITTAEKYAGLKIKVGPVTTQNGGADYFDITTRPGFSGVGSNNDYTMIRMESALSKTNPDMYLQTSGAGGRVIVGGDTAVSSARLNVIGMSGGSNLAWFSGNTTANSNADVIISRTGAGSFGIGQGANIQLGNATNATNLLLQENSGGLQVVSYKNSNWNECLWISPNACTIFGGHVTNSGDYVDRVQAIGSTSNGTDYCFYAQAKTTSQAYGLRLVSTTTGNLAGSITFTGSSASFNTTSDKRAKENIIDSPRAQDILRSIVVRSFNFKNGGEHCTFGFIAQELVGSTPWAVHVGSPDYTEFDGITGMWGVDNSKLVPLIVKSQQELMDELQETKRQLSDTQSELLSMKQTMERILQRLSDLDNKA